VRKAVSRLEIDVEVLRDEIEALKGAHRKLCGAVYGRLGADARHPQRAGRVGEDETLDEFRERMRREGRMRPTTEGVT